MEKEISKEEKVEPGSAGASVPVYDIVDDTDVDLQRPDLSKPYFICICAQLLCFFFHRTRASFWSTREWKNYKSKGNQEAT